MDTTQLLLIVVLSITTILLIIIGVQLIFVLKEVRKTLKKINDIVDGFEHFGINAKHGVSEITGFFAGIKTLFTAIDYFKHKKNEKQSKK